jgi:hypothetical protein
MYITVKLSYYEEEELLKLSELLEIPPREIVEKIIEKVLKHRDLIEKVLN